MFSLTSKYSRASFTLIELLVVLAIVAILSVVVIMTLNPSELIKQARDSTRLSDLSTINTALAAFNTDVTGGFMGTSSKVYVSIPDTSPTCANLGLPTLPSGWTYNCVTATSSRLANGRGWIPVDFTQISFGNPISSLPTDPVNTTSTGDYYTYATGGSWQLSSKFESQKYQPQAAATNNYDPGLYVLGTNLNLAPFVGGLVGWWPFDEGSGASTTDSSGYGNNANLSGVSWVSGKIGMAGQFSGSDSNYASTSANFLGGTVTNLKNYTFTAWVNVSSTAGNTIFLTASGRPYLGITGGKAMFNLNDANLNTGAGTISANTWYMISGVADLINGTVKIYINGAESTSRSYSGSTFDGPGRVFIGRWSGLAYGFPGLVDDVRIYSRALSAAEILALYNATK